MKIYSISTESHRVFKDEWFLPSLCDNFPFHIEELTQQGSGEIGNVAFNTMMLRKVELILRALDEMWGSWFIYSDVDVQFLRPFRQLAESSLQNRDICFQRDSPTGELCAGFFVARANDTVKRLWQDVERHLKNDLSQHDQTWLNRILDPYRLTQDADCPLLRKIFFLTLRQIRLKSGSLFLCAYERKSRLSLQRTYGINIDLLPIEVFGAGSFTGKSWNPSKPFQVPSNATVHHANYAAGITAKIEQLEYVRNCVRQKQNQIHD
jgi:hypothetical protein